jgi:hypothetical protein
MSEEQLVRIYYCREHGVFTSDSIFEDLDDDFMPIIEVEDPDEFEQLAETAGENELLTTQMFTESEAYIQIEMHDGVNFVSAFDLLKFLRGEV